jgi:hypothetical protein
MQALLMVLMVPAALLHVFGGIGAAIWLATLGKWEQIAMGVTGLLFSHLVIATLMLPNHLLVWPATSLMDKGKILLAFPFLLLSNLYEILIISWWCLFVFQYMTLTAEHDTFWPLAAWSYTVSLQPFIRFALKEPEDAGNGAMIVAFNAEVAYMAIVATAALGNTNPADLRMIFGGIMLVSLVVRIYLAIAQHITNTAEDTLQPPRYG